MELLILLPDKIIKGANETFCVLVHPGVELWQQGRRMLLRCFLLQLKNRLRQRSSLILLLK